MTTTAKPYMNLTVHQCGRLSIESKSREGTNWIDITFDPANYNTGLCIFFTDPIYCRKIAHAIHQVNNEHFATSFSGKFNAT